MKSSDIKVGQTYMFTFTDSVARKHLEGQPFEVTEIKPVFRRFKHAGTRKVKRFFNADGIGARPEELEPLSREFPCTECETGELVKISLAGTEFVTYKCDKCGHEATYP